MTDNVHIQPASQCLVTEHEHHMRLDNFLMKKLKGVPKSKIYQLIRTGQVRVNKGRCKAMDKLVQGDNVRIPPLRRELALPPEHFGKMDFSWLEQAIVEKTDAYYVFNKPTGLASHGGSGLSFGLIEAARQAFAEPHLELAHRLDKPTSGCIVVTRKRRFLRIFHEMQREGQVEKVYLALVHGRVKKKHICDFALERQGRQSQVVAEDVGRASLSIVYPLVTAADASLVQVNLHSGRMHQIRAHLSHIGHPLIGDKEYGSDAPEGLALHAYHLAWQEGEAAVIYEAPPSALFMRRAQEHLPQLDRQKPLQGYAPLHKVRFDVDV